MGKLCHVAAHGMNWAYLHWINLLELTLVIMNVTCPMKWRHWLQALIWSLRAPLRMLLITLQRNPQSSPLILNGSLVIVAVPIILKTTLYGALMPEPESRSINKLINFGIAGIAKKELLNGFLLMRIHQIAQKLLFSICNQALHTSSKWLARMFWGMKCSVTPLRRGPKVPFVAIYLKILWTFATAKQITKSRIA